MGLQSLRRTLMGRANVVVGEWFYGGLSRLGRLHPKADPARHNVEVKRNIAYTDSGHERHVLDVYRPTNRPWPYPVVLYIHGGGFHLLSKDTHWLMGLAFARAGYLVVNVGYRLAPRHPFPAAVSDVCAALEWVAEHAPSYGGDLDRLVLAGESAGGNLATALAVATCYRRPELFAQRAFDTGLVPRAVIPACAPLQVSDPERHSRRRRLPGFVKSILEGIRDHYLHPWGSPREGELDLADPLMVFERGDPPDRPLPAFFVPIGTRDPLLDDTRRLERALGEMGVDCEARYYPGELHAFHAFVWRKQAQRCWRETFAFLNRVLNEERSATSGPQQAAAG